MPTKGNPVVTCRLAKPEHDYLRALAEQRGMTVSDLVREAVRASIRDSLQPPANGAVAAKPPKRRRKR